MLEGRNYGERKDIERLEHDVRDQQALSHKNYQDINRLKDIGGARDSENRSLKIRMDNMQNEIEQNNARIAHLNEVKEQKEIDIQNTTQRLNKEQGAGAQLRYENQQLDKEMNYYENLNRNHLQTQ